MPHPQAPTATKVHPTYLTPESRAYIAAYGADLKIRREALRAEARARRFVEGVLRDLHRGVVA